MLRTPMSTGRFANLRLFDQLFALGVGTTLLTNIACSALPFDTSSENNAAQDQDTLGTFDAATQHAVLLLTMTNACLDATAGAAPCLDLYQDLLTTAPTNANVQNLQTLATSFTQAPGTIDQRATRFSQNAYSYLNVQGDALGATNDTLKTSFLENLPVATNTFASMQPFQPATQTSNLLNYNGLLLATGDDSLSQQLRANQTLRTAKADFISMLGASCEVAFDQPMLAPIGTAQLAMHIAPIYCPEGSLTSTSTLQGFFSWNDNNVYAYHHDLVTDSVNELITTQSSSRISYQTRTTTHDEWVEAYAQSINMQSSMVEKVKTTLRAVVKCLAVAFAVGILLALLAQIVAVVISNILGTIRSIYDNSTWPPNIDINMILSDLERNKISLLTVVIALALFFFVPRISSFITKTVKGRLDIRASNLLNICGGPALGIATFAIASKLVEPVAQRLFGIIFNRQPINSLFPPY